MITLGVETSGPIGSLALRCDGRCIEERFLPELGRRHAQSLVPEAIALLRRCGVAPWEVGLVAVSIGPGSFTGLRVGVTFAKTFAYAAGARLVAVETFLAIAGNTPAAPAVAVVADAQRGGLILGRYIRRWDGGFVREGELKLVTPDGMRGLLAPEDVLTGPAVDRATAEASREVAPERLRHPRASTVARLGEAGSCDGAADPWTLEPLYVRKSAAEEKRDADDAKLG